MDFGTIIGFAVGIVAIFGVACGWDLLPYFDIPSVGLVFGGCLATVLAAVPLAKVKKMPGTFLLAFKSDHEDVDGTMKRFVEYADAARKEGILSLESAVETISDPFTRQGLQLAVDGSDPDMLSTVMNTKIDEIDRRHEDNLRGWELCRAAAPAWGAMGTVIGLVQMVKGGVDDPGALISGIAVALLTTFYGSLISTWIIGPVCDKLVERTAEEVMHKNVILQGILSLQNGDPPRVMETKLSAFRAAGKEKGDR